MSISTYLSKHTTVDDKANIIGFSFSGLVVLIGLVAILAMPVPPVQREEKIREWVRKKNDDEEEDRGDQIRLFKIRVDSLKATPSHIQKMSRRALQHRKTLTAMKEYNLTYDY